MLILLFFIEDVASCLLRVNLLSVPCPTKILSDKSCLQFKSIDARLCSTTEVGMISPVEKINKCFFSLPLQKNAN